MNNTETSLVLIANDIRSAHNVGSLFRTASGAGVEKIYLTGYTLVPARPGKLYLTRAEKDLAKTALGAEQEIPYEQRENVEECILELQKNGYQVIGLEQSEASVDYQTSPTSNKVALLIGTEVEGIPKDLQEICDVLYEIPMYGTKNSLNVSVATGIALYVLKSALEKAS